MLGRILLILVLVGLALLVLRWTIWKSNASQRDSEPRSNGRNGSGGGPGGGQPGGGSKSASPLVACEACGLNLPRADAVWKAGRAYCKAEHLPIDR